MINVRVREAEEADLRRFISVWCVWSSTVHAATITHVCTGNAYTSNLAIYTDVKSYVLHFNKDHVILK